VLKAKVLPQQCRYVVYRNVKLLLLIEMRLQKTESVLTDLVEEDVVVEKFLSKKWVSRDLTCIVIAGLFLSACTSVDEASGPQAVKNGGASISQSNTTVSQNGAVSSSSISTLAPAQNSFSSPALSTMLPGGIEIDPDESDPTGGPDSGKQSLPVLTPNLETLRNLDKESNGNYSSTQRKLSTCRELPVERVWKEFAPFFAYKWDQEFEEFVALFLAIWKKESDFGLPSQGVIIQMNCKGQKNVIVKSLHGRSVKGDLSRAKKRDTMLQANHSACNLNLADYGPLQWNHHWRLSRKFYRPQIEKALLMSSQYRQGELKKLSALDLGRLVKYNSKALFILGGLSLKDGSKDPMTTIEDYNTDAKYRVKAKIQRDQFLTMLQNSPSCSILKAEKNRSQVSRR
jgi:hypothetical protein